MINSLSELAKHKKKLNLECSPLYKVTIYLDQNSYTNESMDYMHVQEFEHVVDIIYDDSCICLTMADGCCSYFRTEHVINWIAEREVDE